MTVAVGGNFPAMRRLARALAARGCLERLVTYVPWSRLSDMRGFEQQVVSLGWLGYLTFAMARTYGLRRWFGNYYHQTEIFDRLAARALGPCDVMLGMCTAMLQCLRAAKRLGASTVLYSGSMHLADQRVILEREGHELGLPVMLPDPRALAKSREELWEVDAVVVPSTLVKRSFVARGVDPAKIHVIGEVLPRPLPVVARQPPARFTILSVGTIGVRKGTHHLLEAVARMAEPAPDVILVGGVERGYAPVLRRFEGRFRLAGRIDDRSLAEAYSRASVFVLPSIEDGWGHVVAEASAAGVPVIVSDHAGSADLVLEGRTGFVVPSRDPEAIRQRLEWLRECPDRAEAIGEAGRRRSAEALSEASQTDAIVAAIEGVRAPSV